VGLWRTFGTELGNSSQFGWMVAYPDRTQLFFACWRLPLGRKPSSVRFGGHSPKTAPMSDLAIVSSFMHP
jgi:hypothetical protein